jgi:transcriptional regulator with XRE-family HTH domain
LLQQLGERLKSHRKVQGFSAVEMAKRAQVSRTTLRAVEAGDPRTSIGTYLRIMSALGTGGEVALLASGVMQGVARHAKPKSRSGPREAQVMVVAESARHSVQDLQSLVLHEEAVRLVRSNPSLLRQAQDTLERWLESGDSRSTLLWSQWREILRQRNWRKVLARNQRAQQLRQASPLTTVLPTDVRLQLLAQVKELKKGILIGRV